MPRTVKIADGKYEFDVDAEGIIIEARIYGRRWPHENTSFYNGGLTAALRRIIELEDKLKEGSVAVEDTG